MSHHRPSGGPRKAIGLITSTVVCSVLASASAFGGNSLTLVEDDAWGGPGLGGPFEVSATHAMANPATGRFGADDTHFITFCLEYREHVEQGATYDVQLGEQTEGRFGSDPLDSRTAFLYTQFAEGTLADEFNSWSGSSQDFTYLDPLSGEALQEAIWIIEGDSGLFTPYAPELAAELVAYADAAVAEGGAWFGMGLGQVRVMNLTEDGESRQDMLTIIPLPAPALLGMLGLGLMGGAVTRQRAGRRG